MSYASIMVHVSDDDGVEARLGCARETAALFDATLIGVGAELPPRIVTGDSGDGWFALMTEEADQAIAEADARLKKAEGRFAALAQGLSKPAIWRGNRVLPTAELARAARAADLIVAGRPQGGDARRHADPAELAIVSGRPVLVAPSRPKGLSAARVMLAWKDTREARRALSDAMPFFERADGVLVLEMCGGDDQDNAQIRTRDVAEALRRRGVAAEAQVVRRTAPSGYDVMAEADAFGAGLIVAGAYGHTRLGEWVFGGVTRDLLAHSERHLLFSH